ncbi:glycolate oxidase FAD binding subunit [Streptosporangium subroseum]|uniref:Glycolate oxidase FAD binding subunit n=1 Tax=Streptosporangium subroseum TaxID=106412 RepID=A0A239JPU6_9ACTN|nr:FAD-binding oxidoreductase [Streptosporangium subroseum]SNT07901.1 glycolate oxidase FAD binding subunit [Streptosporangium subroseum]
MKALRHEAEALNKTGVTIREADPGDAVAGVPPRWVALPETTEEVAALMRVSAEHDLAVVPVGGGTKLHWGGPPERCDLLIDTCCLNEVLEHATGDLIVRTQAGVTMDTLAETLGGGGQELALDVPLDGATVGGTIATATAGPRRFRYGAPRDLLIGITVVLADGTVARSGGKVVKNVAGYDLGKLFSGSYGTLGIITEAIFRLHPVPLDRRWITVELPVSGPAASGGARSFPGGLETLVAGLAASQAEPSAVELDWPDVRGGATVAALVEGTAAQGRALAVQTLMGEHGTARITGEPPAWWTAPPGEDVLLELRIPPALAHAALRAIAARELPARVRGSVASTVLMIALPSDVGEPAFAEFVSGLRGDLGHLGGRLTVLAAPRELTLRVDRWGPASALPLMRRVKERFDPGRRLSPGRFVGGI